MYGYLIHHGIKGQKWGVRRYENYDGTLTEAGRKRYGLKEKPITVIKSDQKANLIRGNGSYTKEYLKKHSNAVNVNDDIIFEKGSKFYRITTNKNESNNLSRFYVTQKVGEYWLDFVLPSSFIKTYQIPEDIKIAGKDTVNKILADAGFNNLALNGRPLPTKSGKIYGTTPKIFVLDKEKYKGADIVREYIKQELSKKGYNGLIDPEDAGGYSSSAYIITTTCLNKIKETPADWNLIDEDAKH